MNQKYVAAKKALRSARYLSILSKGYLERLLAEMEEASSMPVGVLKTYIWNIYKEKEPERVQSCIDSALICARGSSITDKSSMSGWLGYAQGHSHSLMDRIVTYFAGLGIKGRYALRPVLSR